MPRLAKKEARNHQTCTLSNKLLTSNLVIWVQTFSIQATLHVPRNSGQQTNHHFQNNNKNGKHKLLYHDEFHLLSFALALKRLSTGGGVEGVQKWGKLHFQISSWQSLLRFTSFVGASFFQLHFCVTSVFFLLLLAPFFSGFTSKINFTSKKFFFSPDRFFQLHFRLHFDKVKLLSLNLALRTFLHTNMHLFRTIGFIFITTAFQSLF